MKRDRQIQVIIKQCNKRYSKKYSGCIGICKNSWEINKSGTTSCQNVSLLAFYSRQLPKPVFQELSTEIQPQLRFSFISIQFHPSISKKEKGGRGGCNLKLAQEEVKYPLPPYNCIKIEITFLQILLTLMIKTGISQGTQSPQI